MSAKDRDDDASITDTKPDAEPARKADVPDAPADRSPADVEEPAPAERKLGRTRASELWAGLIVAALVLIFLLVFILQNLDSVEIQFLGFSGSLPLGVAMLLSAVGGLLMVAIPGVARMIQLRRHARR
ncbi:MAG TPA: lipopolysaccharide assembly protein LapA domain-containing protein [Jiangellaceae bacterium]